MCFLNFPKNKIAEKYVMTHNAQENKETLKV